MNVHSSVVVPSARLFQFLDHGQDSFKLSLDLINEIDQNAYVVLYLYAILC